ncbi:MULTISPECIES: YbaK/EbsC family protein [Saliphagus]|uniref:YbaK/EbsC family protein n=1 Tax=Saliphagus infecundisoli TaxID=1849069 RepID=A0ABD5QIT0_9EURY|nr:MULTISPECIES: YbaK/EbsC family protein [Saliphagus]
MHRRAREFRDRVTDQFGIDLAIHEFPEGTKTAEDAAAAVGCEVRAIASALVFVADGDPIVVVTSGANRASEAKVAEELETGDVRMADPDTVREATGYAIGGVPPFGHDGDVPTLVDETLLAEEEVWAAAGTPEAVFPIDPERLVEFAGARPADVVE